MIRQPYVLSRPQKLYVVCAAIFITALVIAEATASKFFTAFALPVPITILGLEFTSVIMTAGVIAFPVTFIVTDLLNEYYGKAGIRFVTFVGMAMIVFEFALLQAAMAVPTAGISPVPAEAFDLVFGATGRIILGSLVAYLVGQLADITLFHWLRRLTQGRHLWLRATGSTFGSQFLDTAIVLTVAFAGQLALGEIVAITLFNYSYKLVIAVAITPLIYAAHWVIDRYLGDELAEAMIEQAEADAAVLPGAA
ncbi:MAG: queuosine precursor transporter [Rhodothermales bacterium]